MHQIQPTDTKFGNTKFYPVTPNSDISYSILCDTKFRNIKFYSVTLNSEGQFAFCARVTAHTNIRILQLQILVPSAAVSSHKPGYKVRWIIYFPRLDNLFRCTVMWQTTWRTVRPVKTHRIFPPLYLFYSRQSLCFLRRLCRLRIRCRVPKAPVNQPLYREQVKVKQMAESDRWQTSEHYFEGTAFQVLAVGLLSLPLCWDKQGSHPVPQASVRKVMFLSQRKRGHTISSVWKTITKSKFPFVLKNFSSKLQALGGRP